MKNIIQLLIFFFLFSCASSSGNQDIFNAEDIISKIDLPDLGVDTSETAETDSLNDLQDIPDFFIEYYEIGDLKFGEDIWWNDIEKCQAGYPCSSGSECCSGWCVMGSNGWECSSLCQDTCPFEGWKCQEIAAPDGAKDKICIYPHALLCSPCNFDYECNPPYLPWSGHTCISLGKEGNFCGVLCASAKDCPSGYQCKNVTSIQGESSKQCVPDTEICECPGVAMQYGSETSCYDENNFGKCSGKRACTFDGIEPCSAPQPSLGQVCNPDEDGDKSPDWEDCEPYNKDVFPGNIETCNDKDDNCNDEIDEGENAINCQQFLVDNDEDGFGGSDIKCFCNPTKPYTATNSNDCNDNNKEVNPSHAEVCADPEDNDCSGTSNDENADGCKNFYKDNDFDGYGAGTPLCLCEAKNPYVSESGDDCNDADKNINKGVQETCATEYDDNCNGSNNDIDSVGCQNFYYDYDNDAYGTSDFKCLCDEAGIYRAIKTNDCDDKKSSINPGVKEICNNNIDDNCDGNQDTEDAQGCEYYYYDNDGDEFGLSSDKKCLCKKEGKYSTLKAGDCDDTMKSINPDIKEICNSVDDNCNSKTDEEDAKNCQNYFYDGDSDGHGDPLKGRCLCNPDGKWTSLLATDCNDNDQKIFFGADEYCNSIDDDCDNETDEENASDCENYYYDSDGDKYGDPNNFKCLCKPLQKYNTKIAGDCNDGISTINPEAMEVCGNKIDDNCNSKTDEEDGEGCKIYYHDFDDDGYGDPLDSKCLCGSAEKYDVQNSDDCDDSDSSIHKNAAELCNKKDDDCDTITDEDIPDQFEQNNAINSSYNLGFMSDDGSEPGAPASRLLYPSLHAAKDIDYFRVWGIEKSSSLSLCMKATVSDLPEGLTGKACIKFKEGSAPYNEWEGCGTEGSGTFSVTTPNLEGGADDNNSGDYWIKIEGINDAFSCNKYTLTVEMLISGCP